MSEESHRRLKAKAIVIGYAMSRLDRRYLEARGCKSWKEAFAGAAEILNVRASSIKNLRDEFDPFHRTLRKGWHKRPLRSSRQRVMGELCELSDGAIIELVSRLLGREDASTTEAIDSLVRPDRTVHNIAERLLTGRIAEEYFLSHCHTIVGISRSNVLDMREAASGYDFGVANNVAQAIEVKGLKEKSGPILFTDREWKEAKTRSMNYWLVVVGNLVERPVVRVWQDPASQLKTTCHYQRTVAATWRSVVSVAI